MNRNDFIEYVWSFYGPNQLYGEFFKNTLTREELESAVSERMESESFEGDSFDREAVRDIMLKKRGQ